MLKNQTKTKPEITLKEVVGDKRYRLQIFGPAAITDEGIMPFEEQMAVISHYLHNEGTPEAQTYRDRAEALISDICDVKFGRPKANDGEAAEAPSRQYNLFPDLFSVPFPTPSNPKFTFIDLFAGIGGFRIAMQAQGGRCVFSSEWNQFAQRTYLANFGEVPFGDITKASTKSYIPKEFDVLCAGFPCQPFSIAGVSKKKSLGRETGFQDKTQGTLFFDVADIISRHRPKAFYLENVKNLTSHDKGKTFRIICETLEELDYTIHYAVLDGQYYVPQHRERIMIVDFDRNKYVVNAA